MPCRTGLIDCPGCLDGRAKAGPGVRGTDLTAGETPTPTGRAGYRASVDVDGKFRPDGTRIRRDRLASAGGERCANGPRPLQAVSNCSSSIFISFRISLSPL